MNDGIQVSVILPTYNEADTVTTVIKQLQDTLADTRHEIIVVDDDSPDKTWKIAEDAGARVIRRTQEKGLATAVQTGLKVAHGEYAVVMDADLQHPPRTVPDLVAALDEAELAVASRYHADGGITDWPWYRHLLSRGATLLAKAALPGATRSVSDPVSGFFAVRRDAVDVEAMQPRGFKILLDILPQVEDGVAEVPYTFTGRTRGTSSLDLSTMVMFLTHLASLSVRYEQAVYRFGAVGLSGALINLTVLHVLTTVFNIHYAVSGVAAVETGISWNFFWNNWFTFGMEHNTARKLVTRWVRYHAATFIGAVINLSILVTGHELLGLHYLVAQALGIGGGFTANYVLGATYAWKD